MRKRKAGIICILLGILLVAAAAVWLVYNKLEDERAEEASQSVLAALQEQAAADSRAEEEIVVPADTAGQRLSGEMTTALVDGYDYIGFLTLPVLDIELPVMADWDYARLRIAPCRQFGSVKDGDLVIAAHNYPGHFGKLHSLTYGDLLLFTDMDGKTTAYAVSGIETLQPTEADELQSGDWDITLYTCTYGGKNRVTVRFTQIDAASAEKILESYQLR